MTARALLAAALLLLAGVACSGQNSQYREDYPFSLPPEFPVASSDDEVALRAAVNAVLSAPEWSEAAAHPDSWEFSGIAVLTRNGERAGVYGDADFAALVSLPGPLTFIRCGQSETWQREGGPPFRLGGLHVRLMDGDDGPWQALPLNTDGELPSLREIQEYTGSVNACP